MTTQTMPQPLYDRFENEWRQIREGTSAPEKSVGNSQR